MSSCVAWKTCRSFASCRLLFVALFAINLWPFLQVSAKIFKCPEKFGYFPDDNECTKYYMCVFGDAFHERCTGGLHFSASRGICDWPRNAQCESNKVPSESASSPTYRNSKTTTYGRANTSPPRQRVTLGRAGSRFHLTEAPPPARAPTPSPRKAQTTARPHPVLTPAPENRYSPRIVNTRLVALTEASRPPGYYNVIRKSGNLQPEDEEEEDDDEEEEDEEEENNEGNQRNVNIYVKPVYNKRPNDESVGKKEEKKPDPDSLVVVMTNNGKYKDPDVDSIQTLPNNGKAPNEPPTVQIKAPEVPIRNYNNNIRRSPDPSGLTQSIQTPDRRTVTIPSRQPVTHGFGRPRSYPETSAVRPISSPINDRSKDVPLNSRQIINPIYTNKNSITRPNPIRTNGRTPLLSRHGSTYQAGLSDPQERSERPRQRYHDSSNSAAANSRRGSTYLDSIGRTNDNPRQSFITNNRRTEVSRQNPSLTNRESFRYNPPYSSDRDESRNPPSSYQVRQIPDRSRPSDDYPQYRNPSIPTYTERTRRLPETVATSRQTTPPIQRTTPSTFRQQLSIYLKRVPDVSVPSTYNSGDKRKNSDDVIPVNRNRPLDSDVSSIPKQSLDNSDTLDAQYGTNPTSVRLPDVPVRVQSFVHNKDTKKNTFNRHHQQPYQFEEEADKNYDDYPDYYFEDDEEEEEVVNTPRPRVSTPAYRPPPPPPTTTTTTTTTTTIQPPVTQPGRRRLPFGISRPATRAPSIFAGRPPPPASRPRSVYPTPRYLSSGTKCSPSKCRLPDCYCGTTDTPLGMSINQIPQIVLITFDDAMNDLNFELYSELFGGRKNPNGCPTLGTFYVSHEWTDYGKVQTLYSQGHEMASHGVTHSFGEKFSVGQWHKEIHGQREVLHLYGGVKMEDVRGMRAPFLQTGGNKMFEMLYEANFTYDSSLPVPESNPPYWPYTLDYNLNHQCMIPPCPTKSFPGLWEVGMIMWTDLRGGRCSMGDACTNPTDEEGVYKMLMKNFNRHYKTNRAPFGAFYHSAWFNTPHHRRAFMKFLDEIMKKNDVWVVTNWQAIQWMRNPTPVSKLNNFEPWQCDYSDRPGPCNHAKSCQISYKGGSRSMRTCQPCPSQYPWIGKTGYNERYG